MGVIVTSLPSTNTSSSMHVIEGIPSYGLLITTEGHLVNLQPLPNAFNDLAYFFAHAKPLSMGVKNPLSMHIFLLSYSRYGKNR